ncbi:GIY-YIG nuclease family protein [Alteromonas stellipolaris]|uniref:GIY-YIG nuclease family protein n=1 Tax=Alteromonas stellipolaris TaxID=233316 RepID=UPI0024940EC0|nr:GIY-YIG nuclease family protein [Alteromonas stellipolaris]
MYFKLPMSITANNVNTHQQPSTWYLYLIENKLGQLYTGITTSPARRISQHRGEIVGGARALKGKGPLHFRAIFLIGDRSTASQFEYKVKRLSKEKKWAIVKQKVLPKNLFENLCEDLCRNSQYISPCEYE